MNTNLTKQLLDSFYRAQQALNTLPPLPENMTSQYIHILDAIVHLENEQKGARVSDIAERLHVSLPGITRSLKAMKALGVVQKLPAANDRRVVILTLTPHGRRIYDIYVTQYHEKLAGILSGIPDEDILTTIRTIQTASDCMKSSPISLSEERSK